MLLVIHDERIAKYVNEFFKVWGKISYPKEAFFYGIHACAVEGLDNGCLLLVKKS